MSRPFVVIPAVGLLAALWLGLAGGIVLAWESDTALFEIFAGVFWSSVWCLWVVRVWLGGPTAIGLMRKAMFTICPLLLVAAVAAVAITGGDVYPEQLLGVAAALGGIVAGALLSRGDVREWSRSTAVPRVVRQPPDGVAFDLRGAALRQGRAFFGCGMLLAVVVVLLVVGAIGAMLPAGRETDAPDYVAFMAGVVLLVVVGVAGYVRVGARANAMGVLTVTDRGINEHPWDTFQSVALTYEGEAKVVSGVHRYPKARLDLVLDDSPDTRHLALPNDAHLHGSIASALAERSPGGLFRGWVQRAG